MTGRASKLRMYVRSSEGKAGVRATGIEYIFVLFCGELGEEDARHVC